MLISGGGDSVALLDLAVRAGAQVSALHVNYGLREGAAGDEELVRSLCDSLGVPLFAERVELGAEGNLQELARDARYALAEALATGRYATGHTASDQAETVLYRLAVSPGSRALHGMPARRGRLVRPLLGVTREEVRDTCARAASSGERTRPNADRRFARARVRHDLMEALRTIGPAAERTIAETARQLREEAEVLDAAVDAGVGGARRGPAVSASVLCASRRPCAAWCCAGWPRPPAASSARATPSGSSRSGGRGSKSLDLGGGLRAVVEYGTLRFTRAGGRRCGPARSRCRCPAGSASATGRWRRARGRPGT